MTKHGRRRNMTHQYPISDLLKAMHFMALVSGWDDLDDDAQDAERAKGSASKFSQVPGFEVEG
jgi:hypothetical protein